MGDKTKRILVVDDEIKITDVVKSYLESAGYEVYVAYNGKQALELFEEANPALIVLDLMLPDLTGEEVCKIIRKRSTVPIIMLTAKVDEENILKGLDIGSDDYVTKPFSPRQLVARVGALLRRTSGDNMPLSRIFSFNDRDLVIDCTAHEVKKAGRMLGMTPNEFKILLALVRFPAKVFTREELINVIGSEDIDVYDRTIDSHIKNIRQKIESDSKNPVYILTVHGIGYKFGGEV